MRSSSSSRDSISRAYCRPPSGTSRPSSRGGASQRQTIGTRPPLSRQRGILPALLLPWQTSRTEQRPPCQPPGGRVAGNPPS
jgi:hypothetical protein